VSEAGKTCATGASREDATSGPSRFLIKGGIVHRHRWAVSFQLLARLIRIDYISHVKKHKEVYS